MWGWDSDPIKRLSQANKTKGIILSISDKYPHIKAEILEDFDGVFDD